MIRIWALLFLTLSFSVVGAQTMINGLVNSKDEKRALPGVSITVKEKDSATLLAYAITNDKGSYQLNFKSAADSVIITVSGYNLKKQIVVFQNKSRVLNFDMTPEAIKLKEVKINPPKILKVNDTLNYAVDRFADKNDRTIGDVLRKMPGITVKEDGSIMYNNKPINKFYIENSDLLQGRYGIATNNIEAKDVATVQVLENHQPIKALKDIEFTDEGAINLKLKSSAKGVALATAQVGAGLSPVLWNNQLITMYFNKRRQNMNTYKGNNTGTDDGADFNLLYSNDVNDSPGSRLSVAAPSPPSISQNRYLFNRDNAISVNNLWTVGKDYEVTANASYFNDIREKNSYSRSVYYLPGDSILTIEETLASIERINVLDGAFQLNTNKEKYYLDNTLKFTGKWNSEEGSLFKSDPVSQDLNKPLFKVSNTFNLIRKYKKISLRIYSLNKYSSIPQILVITPLLYPDLFRDTGGLSAMRQSVKQVNFSSVNKLSFELGKGAFKQNYTVGMDVDLQQFNSILQAQTLAGSFTMAADSIKNSLHWGTYELYFIPDYTYMRNKLRTTVSLPLVYNYLQTRDLIHETGQSGLQNKNTSRLFFNPSFTIRYELSLFWNLSAAARYNNNRGNIENGFTGYIMQSYRNLVRNDGQMPEQEKQSYNINLGYRNPLHAVFLNMGSSYFRNKMNLLYGYDYLGILSVRKTYHTINIADEYTAYLRASKGIDKLASTVTFEADYSDAAASQISQEQIVNFINEYYVIKPGFSSKIGKWASFSYSYQYMESKNKVRNNISIFPSIQTRTQRSQLNLFPVEGFTINLAYEKFYNNAVTSGNRTVDFADVGIKIKFRKMEFNLKYTNIFNAEQYISASFSDISSFYSVYRLRPAQILIKVRFKIK